jgi:hypothetical protein
MAQKTYSAILRELSVIGFNGRFSPYLMNEPLLDKRMPALLKEARHTLPKCVLFLSTNGDALTPETGIAMLNAGLDKLLVNNYDADHHRTQRLRSIIDRIVKAVPSADCWEANNIEDVLLASRGNGPVIALNDASSWTVEDMTNRAGNVPGATTPQEPLKKGCYRPFKQLYVRFNGDCVLCCCDWKGEVVFGNIESGSLEEIYASEVAQHYRANLARGNRDLPLCRLCDSCGQLGTD